jgi:hypothetical protein
MNSRRTAVLYLAGVFLAGGLTGGFGGYALGRRPIFRPPNPQSMAEHLVGHFRNELNLSEDQVTKVRPLVEQATAEADTIHAATFERVHGVMTNLNRRIEEFLTPEQRQKLAERERQLQDRFQHKGRRPGPSPGPPPQR